MIVDCHTHVNRVGNDVLPSEYFGAAENVDVCIVLAGVDDDSERVNKELAEYISKYKEKMVGFAFLDPTKDKTRVKDLTFIREKLGLEGIVLHCSSCGFHPAHSEAMMFYDSAQEVRLPIFFHNGCPAEPYATLDYAQPFLLDEVARTFPDLKIVIGSMGIPFVEQTLLMVAKHENVYADLTIKPGNVWQVYNIVVAAHEYGVMNKLLFGSGYPFSKASACMETLLGFNKLLGDADLPTVPRGSIQDVIERKTLELLGIRG